MLLQIREYISREQVVSTQQLVREFCLELPALQPMLDLWVKKGAIEKYQDQGHCQSSCFKCREKPPEYYRYLDKTACKKAHAVLSEQL
jgi:hypothetical protein